MSGRQEGNLAVLRLLWIDPARSINRYALYMSHRSGDTCLLPLVGLKQCRADTRTSHGGLKSRPVSRRQFPLWPPSPNIFVGLTWKDFLVCMHTAELCAQRVAERESLASV